MRETFEDARDTVSGWPFLAKAGVGLVVAFFLILFGWLTYRVMFLTWVDNYQFAYTYDYWTGKQAPVAHNGYVFAPPLTRSVHTIDLRPMQVCISSIQRVLNCKLVHFDPYAKDPDTGLQGWELFIRWHGRGDYEGPGTSTTASTTDSLFRAILTNYAYDGTGRSYPFLVIEKELKGDAVIVPQSAPVPKPPEAKQ